MENISSSAKYIKVLRTSLKMTQKEFAEFVNVSFTTVNRWENGHHFPSSLARERLDKVQNLVI